MAVTKVDDFTFGWITVASSNDRADVSVTRRRELLRLERQLRCLRSTTGRGAQSKIYVLRRLLSTTPFAAVCGSVVQKS